MHPAADPKAARVRRKTSAPTGAAGFSLVEVVVATVITIIAVLGLAHSFGVGRGLIDRYASARDAVALAQRRLEILSMLGQSNPAHPDLAAPSGGAAQLHGPSPLLLNGSVPATEEWTVQWVDDPIDQQGGADVNGTDDYKRVTVTVRWSQYGVADRVEIATSVYPQ